MQMLRDGLLFVLVACCAPLSAQGVITTVVGTSKVLPSGPLSPLNTGVVPTSVAVAPNGDVYFSDQPSHQVLKLSRGVLSVVAGNGFSGFSGDGGPAVSAALAGPAGVAVDSKGNLFVADQNNQRVRRISTDGTISTVAGNGGAGFSGDGQQATSATIGIPSSVAIDASGNLYIADLGNRRIRRVSTSGVITSIAGNGSSLFSGDGGSALNAGFVFPQEIALDQQGNLYVDDPADETIRRIDSSGIITTVAGIHQFGFSGDGGPATKAALALPRGVSAGPAGNVCFADLGSNRVRCINPSGIINTVAGTGQPIFSGDGGDGMSAGLAVPQATAFDPSGKLYIADTGNHRLRQLSSAGVIGAIAGNGQADALRDGGPNRNGTVFAPGNIAFDNAGNLYIADSGNQRVRQISIQGAISTIAGVGSAGYSGDGGQAVAAALSDPLGIAVYGGDVFIADRNNHRVRRITSGVISTFAGNGQGGFGGDGGLANAAQLAYPSGLAVDRNGNLFIADSGNARVRKVSPSGIITTIAGTSQAGFSGDGGKASQAMLNDPTAVAVDSSGNVYIVDTGNNRVRRVDLSGSISTVAGNGTASYGGVGGPATSASLNSPLAATVDSVGNLYIADTQSSRILRVNSDGMISVFAGTGESGFSGDGGQAVNAQIQFPAGLAIDSFGNVFFSDRDNNRIREVLVRPPSFSATPNSLIFSAPAGTAIPTTKSVLVSSLLNNAGLAFLGAQGLSFTASPSDKWLSVTPQSGSLANTLQVGADASQLSPGSYKGTLTVTSPDAVPSTQSVPVNFIVGQSVIGQLSIGSQILSFALTQGAASATLPLTLTNQGSGSVQFTATATTKSGGGWLQVSPGNGLVASTSPVTLTVTADPRTLDVGTYAGAINITSPDTGQSIVE
jgi:sugar lactone lactonase YvrE